MPLFHFEMAEWAFFIFILATASIATGAIGSYSEHPVTWGLGTLFNYPFENTVVATFNSPFALLTPLVFIAFLAVFIGKFIPAVDPGLMGGILFGVIVLTLMA